MNKDNKIIKLIKKYREQISYVIVGGLTTVVSLLSYYISTLFLDANIPFELQCANVISWVCAVSFAFITNRKIVFRSDNNPLLESVKFVASRLFTLLVDMGCMALFVTLLNINDKISKLIVQVIVFVLNYVLSKLVVFVKKKQ